MPEIGQRIRLDKQTSVSSSYASDHIAERSRLKKLDPEQGVGILAGAGAIVSTMIVLSAFVFSGPARAQQWIEYEDRLRGFSINFPHEPRTERIDYTTVYGETVPARRYFAERGTGRYTFTVVYFFHSPTDSHTAISFAAQTIRDKGTPTYDAFDNLDGIPGQIVSVTEPNGRRIQAGIYFINQRLYIAEGSVAAGDATPLQFMQSIMFIDPEGERIIPEPD